MGKVNGGELFVRTVRAHEIDVMFTLHGGHLDAIFQSCLDHRLRLIDTRHEAAAGHAADALSRLTRKPGVALVTAGPGLTNIVTALGGAYLESRELLVLGGQVKTSDLATDGIRQRGIQEIDGVRTRVAARSGEKLD